MISSAVKPNIFFAPPRVPGVDEAIRCFADDGIVAGVDDEFKLSPYESSLSPLARRNVRIGGQILECGIYEVYAIK